MGKKIGEGHMSAMGRQGLRELRASMYPDSNVAQSPEYGLYGTKTPGEVADDRRPEDDKKSRQDMDEEKPSDQRSILADREREADSRSSRDDRDLDRDR